MKYFFRLLIYLSIFFFTFSVLSVLVLAVVPVTVTPLKVIRLVENLPDEGYTVRSRWTSLSNINPLMPQAVVATEDNNYLIHNGFDFEAIEKAIEENKRGRRMRGASTISQQTAKNVFCLPDRTWVRKAAETYFTFWIELIWSKERIMEVYLNVIETHPGVYGVGATARIFYDKPASKLNRYEAAMIATVLPNPLRMNLAAPSNYMVRRSARVRGLMNMLGPVDFDAPKDKTPPKKKKKR